MTGLEFQEILQAAAYFSSLLPIFNLRPFRNLRVEIYGNVKVINNTVGNIEKLSRETTGIYFILEVNCKLPKLCHFLNMLFATTVQH